MMIFVNAFIPQRGTAVPISAMRTFLVLLNPVCAPPHLRALGAAQSLGGDITAQSWPGLRRELPRRRRNRDRPPGERQSARPDHGAARCDRTPIWKPPRAPTAKCRTRWRARRFARSWSCPKSLSTSSPVKHPRTCSRNSKNSRSRETRSTWRSASSSARLLAPSSLRWSKTSSCRRSVCSRGGLDWSNKFVVLRDAPGGAAFTTAADAAKAGAITWNYGNFRHADREFSDRRVLHFPARARDQQYEAPKPGAAAPVSKDCPFCSMTIPIKATRCPHCTSEMSSVARA